MDEEKNFDFYEKRAIESLRQYKSEQAFKSGLLHLFSDIKIICDAAKEAGFDDTFVYNLGLNLALSGIVRNPNVPK